MFLPDMIVFDMEKNTFSSIKIVCFFFFLFFISENAEYHR